MMEDLRKVHFRPLPNGNFVIDAYDRLGYHIERELRFVEMEGSLLFQDYLQITFKRGKSYRIWFRDIDFGRGSVPLYVRGGRVKSDYFHAVYAVIAEVSYFASGCSEKINREYLRNTPELAKFYANRDLEAMIRVMLEAAGVSEPSAADGYAS